MKECLLLNQDREIWPDLLRIIAAFSVIFLHTACSRFWQMNYSPLSTEFQFCNIYSGISRWNVPVFVMISGMFFLDPHKEYSLKKLYFNKIFRIATAYLVWAIFYGLVQQYHAHHAIHMKSLIKNIIFGGHYHLWFLFMLAGLYVATPVLRHVVKNEKVLIYFILLGFITVFCSNILSMMPVVGYPWKSIIDRLDLKLFAGYSTYFLLGYWLTNHKPEKKQRTIIYVLGIFSVIATVVINSWLNIRFNKTRDYMFSNLYLNVFLTAVAVFVFFQNFFSERKFSEKQKKIIIELSRLSFGIYLVHAFVLEYMIGMPRYFIHPAFAVPIISCVTFLISLAIVFCIDKIPFVRKYAI